MNDGGAAAAAAARARAIKALGPVVRVEPGEFQRIVNRDRETLVVHAPGGFLAGGHRYLTSYKGLVFYAKSRDPISFPGGCELMEAGSISIVG